MVVRKGESSLDNDAYQMVNGGGKFYDFSKHPYAGMSTREGGRAAGAPQYIPSTWAELADRYGFTGFTPQEQDEGFVGCLVKRGALDDVVAGRFDVAVAKCRLEWTSLPGAAENTNQKWTMAAARSLYQQYGGSFDDGTQPAAPIEDRSTYVGSNNMAPLALLSIFGPIISALIPQVAKLFDKKAETPDKITAAQTVIDTIVKSTGAVNAQQAVETIQKDPAALAEATKAVLTEPSIMAVLEVGGGVVKAREFDVQQQQQEKSFWRASAVFWVSVLLLPMVYWLVGSLIVGGVKTDDLQSDWMKMLFRLFGTEWNGESRSGGFNLVIGLVLGGICGVYYGISVTQQRAGSNNSGGGDKVL